MLVHPYHDFSPCDKRYKEYHSLWTKGLSENAKGSGVFAMIALPFTFLACDQETNLSKVARKKFKTNLFLERSGKIFGHKFFYDVGLAQKITDPTNVKVVARGVYTQRCVFEALSLVLDNYNIPEENGLVNLVESIDAREFKQEIDKFREKKGFISFQELKRLEENYLQSLKNS